MAITNHPQLVQAIQDWMMDRSDLAAFAPDCVTLAEAYFNYGGDWDKHDRPLRCRQMETIVSIAPDANGRYLLPPDYLQYKAIAEVSENPRRSLAYIDPVGANRWYPSRGGGMGDNFSIVGDSLYGYPNSGQSIELIYYAKIPALTELSPVNWLIRDNPGIYLNGALMMAADKIKFAEEQQKYAVLLRSFVSGMNDADQFSRFNRAGLSMLGPCP